MTEKELLEEQLNKLSNVTNITMFDNWRTESLSIFSAIYGDKSCEYKNLWDTGLYLSYAKDSDTTDYVETSKSLLNGCIKAIGIHHSNHTNNKQYKNNVVINNNPNFSQSQIQTQIQTMDIKDIIKDELPPAKMREIEEILKTEESEKTKLEKVGAILQKVGINITSSVLAKIITASLDVF